MSESRKDPAEARGKSTPGGSFFRFATATFAVSWSLWLPVVLLNVHTTESPAGAGLFFLGGFGPSIVGGFIILRSREVGGLRRLLDRVTNPGRIPLLWGLVALGLYPAVFVASVGVNLLLGGSPPEAAGLRSMLTGPLPFLGNLVLVLLLGPLSEEVGWRGYGLEVLQRGVSPLAASLVVGVVWWAWHIPLFFMRGTLHNSQGLFSAFTVGYLLTVVSYSVAFTWLYNHTRGSILVAVLAHFSVNMTIAAASPFDGALFTITTVFLLAVGAIMYASDRRLGLR